MRAMILAAGRGERMRPLTDELPKPLLQVGGRPLIQYHIERLVAAGVRDIVVNTAWKSERLAEFLGDGARFGARIQLSEEGTALETAGGIRRALPLLGEAPFLVVNGDIWTDYDFADLAAGDGGHRLAHLVLVQNPVQHPAGDFALDGTGHLDLGAGPRFTFAGISRLSPALFAGIPEGSAPLAPLLRKHATRVSGEIFHGLWFDVGTPERLAQLDQQLRTATCAEPGLWTT